MDNIIEVNNLSKHFKVGKNKELKAVDNVSFAIKKGETLGLVGESGCGKTTTGRTIINLLKANSGEVLFKGRNIADFNKTEMLKFRKECQIIFQDPYASLNGRMTVKTIIREGLDVHGMYDDAGRNKKVYELLKLVGLSKEHANRFPHEFSGGQRQRIGIARALAIDPEFIVCDEPISALDVSIQAQIINLLIGLQKKFGLTYLFIAHDLSMVKHISDRIAVMYLGSIVELAECEELFSNTLHPYTEALFAAIPIADPDIENTREKILLEGDVPSPIDLPKGCKFYGRCPKAIAKCKDVKPAFREVSKGHFVACHLCEEGIINE